VPGFVHQLDFRGIARVPVAVRARVVRLPLEPGAGADRAEGAIHTFCGNLRTRGKNAPRHLGFMNCPHFSAGATRCSCAMGGPLRGPGRRPR
jgi:hypothetical protein